MTDEKKGPPYSPEALHAWQKKSMRAAEIRAMTREQMVEIARGNVERHLGDVQADYENEDDAVDALYDEAFTLGFDALHDAGVPDDVAREVAIEVASLFAQP